MYESLNSEHSDSFIIQVLSNRSKMFRAFLECNNTKLLRLDNSLFTVKKLKRSKVNNSSVKCDLFNIKIHTTS
jgi:hypothetical protein